MRGGPALTIGNFDGVHCGHQALIRAARDRIGAAGRVVALAFHPHPASVLRPEAAPAPLSTWGQRTRWIQGAGADEVVHLEPAPDILALSPDTFISRLAEQWRPSLMVEGRDFRFGRNRAGTVADLERLGRTLHFDVCIIEPVEVALTDHSVTQCSSTMTRWLVARGRMDDASIILGRPYEIESTVEQGAQRGRQLGFPTINLAPNGCLLPADGIYAGVAELPDRSVVTAAISVGTNPTFAQTHRTCEAYLLDWNGWHEEYSWRVRLRFSHWLRDQIAFAGIDPLKAQLARDVERTRALSAAVSSAIHA